MQCDHPLDASGPDSLIAFAAAGDWVRIVVRRKLYVEDVKGRALARGTVLGALTNGVYFGVNSLLAVPIFFIATNISAMRLTWRGAVVSSGNDPITNGDD